MKSRLSKWIAGAAAAAVVALALPASAQTTYNIASIADFTGPYADIMKDLVGARRAAVDWWNDEIGKGMGIKVGIKDYDGRYDAAQRRRCAVRLLHDSNASILGCPDKRIHNR